MTALTKIFGASDDLIEFRGDVHGEVCNDKGLIICSDGTVLSIKYGKPDLAVWQIVPIRMGDLFVEVKQCFDEDADPYSDIAYFVDGLKWAYVATEWQKAE
jgi:hypothetical protein